MSSAAASETNFFVMKPQVRNQFLIHGTVALHDLTRAECVIRVNNFIRTKQGKNS